MKPKITGARCNDCPLKDHPFVAPEGDPDARVALVGKAPDREESRLGRPFMGQPGQLLDKVLGRIGQDRKTLWLTNTVLCHPPENRPPTPLEVDCCFPRLLAELVGRRRIVPLGALALNALVPGRQGILKRRGKPIAWNTLIPETSAVILPTVDLVYVLSNGGALTELERDLRRAFDPVLAVGEQVDDVKVRVPKDRPEAIKFLTRLMHSEFLSFDLETTGLNPFTDKIVLVSLCAEPGLAYVFPGALFEPDEPAKCRIGEGTTTDPAYALRETLRGTLLKPSVIGHNAKFDCKFLAEQWGIDVFPEWDTMLMHYVLDERQGTHGLKQLARDLLGAPDYAAELSRLVKNVETQGYGGVPLDVLIPYAARDVHYTLLLKERLERELEKFPKLRELYHSTVMPAAWLYTDMERAGIAVDKTHTRKVRRQWDQELVGLLAQIRKHAGEEFNPNSPKQLQELLYHNLHYPVQRKDGKVTVDAKALHALQVIQPTPVLNALLRFRKLSKLKSTYLDAILEKVSKDGRLRSEFNLHGTVTGRPSSHDPNMLNIPRVEEDSDGVGKAVKDCFVAAGGTTLIQGDYSQQEVRVLAHYADDPVLKAACAAGTDIHAEVAKAIFGAEIVTKQQRFFAKSIVFGLSYGMGIPGLALKLNVSHEEAQRFVRMFFAKMPACQKWQHDTLRETAALGYLETVTGRRRRFGLVSHETMQEYRNQALNFRIQSTSADITYRALLALQPLLQPYEAKILLSVYDSIIVECPTMHVPKVGRLLHDTMVQVAEEILPDIKFAVDVDYGKRWGSMKKLKLEEPQ